MLAVTTRQPRITKRVVDGLLAGEIVWDSEIRGFGVRCQQRDKVYVLKVRLRGRQRWFTIGRHGSPWTPDTAREKALRMLSDIAEGQDLAVIRAGDRIQPPSMTELCERYIREHAQEHKKASSRHTDERNIENHVKPLLGKLDVRDVTQSDIDNFKRAVRDGRTATPGAESRQGYRGGAVVSGGTGVANRCLALLSKMFNLAERWGWRANGTNPVRHVEKYREGKCERYLTVDEIGRLGNALTEVELANTATPSSIAAIRLLLFTGARLSEILTLRWENVSFERQVLELSDSKTGRKQIFLSAPALKVLSKLPRLEGNPYVIVGEKSSAHLVNLQKPWGRIRQLAKLQDVRLHDLRHSFASIAAASGMSLPVIGKLLGHARATTTERYAHLSQDPIRLANDEIASRIHNALSKRRPIRET